MTKKKRKITPRRIHNLIKQKLRLASLSSPYKQLALDKAKVDSATHECNGCGAYIYSGTSNKNLKALKKKHPSKKFKREKPQCDHLNAVIEVGVGFVDWNTYIERLFCTEDGYQILCDDCHKAKSKEENSKR